MAGCCWSIPCFLLSGTLVPGSWPDLALAAAWTGAADADAAGRDHPRGAGAPGRCAPVERSPALGDDLADLAAHAGSRASSCRCTHVVHTGAQHGCCVAAYP